MNKFFCGLWLLATTFIPFLTVNAQQLVAGNTSVLQGSARTSAIWVMIGCAVLFVGLIGVWSFKLNKSTKP